MERAKLFAILLTLTCLLCGCASNPRQDKADITPFQLAENISFRKEALSLNGIEMSSPRQITSNGESLFICDSGNSRIIRCDIESGKITALGQLGEFVEPVCIASSDTEICVYDRGSSCIQVLNFDGKPVWEHCLDDEFDFLSEVVGVEISDDGAVYFSLIAYDKHTSGSGVYLIKDDELKKICDYTVGTLCSGGDNIFYMSKYALQDDNTWLSGYAELLKITGENYERVSAFSDGFSAVGLEYYDGRLYVYDSCTKAVHTFSSNGEYIETVFSEPVVNDFSYNGFCGGENGIFYLCDTKGNAVYKLVKNE